MIFKFLFYILVLFVAFCLAGVLFFVWMARKTKRQIDEMGQRMGHARQEHQGSGVRMEGQSKNKGSERKIFSDDEGEYVDFEEEK